MEQYVSPVQQDFIWIAEYVDGTNYCEFDLKTKQENNFYQIKKNETLRFGIIGHSMKMIFEVFGGVFKINGQMIEILYKTEEKEYHLTGQQKMYNDLITYKDAESSINLLGGGINSTSITQFNFGYKINLNIDNVNFNFKPIFKLPYGTPAYFNFWLVSDTNLNGIVQIKKNGKIVEQIKAPLKAGIGGEINWTIK